MLSYLLSVKYNTETIWKMLMILMQKIDGVMFYRTAQTKNK